MSWVRDNMIITSLLVLVVVIVGWWFFSGNGDLQTEVETTSVQQQEIEEVVSETGFIEPAQDANLSFSIGGRIVDILVSDGVTVATGSEIAQLESGSAEASVSQAEANLAREQARLSELVSGVRKEQITASDADVSAARQRLQSAKKNLGQVKENQNENVRSAREDLFNTNLQAHLVDGEDENTNEDFTPPTISGTYDATTTGKYRIELYRSQARSGWSFRLSGLGNGSGKVSTTQPQPIGNGLYIEFPDNFAAGRNVVWEVPVPNTRASGYTALKNAVQQAKKGRQLAIEQAESKVTDAESALAQAKAQADLATASSRKEQVAAQEAAVAAARAQLEQAESTLADHTSHAPFAGTVTNVDVSVGEMISAGQPVAELIADSPYHVSVDVPEVDSTNLDVGDPARISLDALPDEVFAGEVVSIAPTAETTEGVQTIETTVAFSGSDSRIRSGLSADIDITTATTSKTLSIPSRAVQRNSDGQKFVYQISENGAGLTQTQITTGLEGSDGLIEIVDGLSAGQEIVTFLTQDLRRQLQASGRIN